MALTVHFPGRVAEIQQGVEEGDGALVAQDEGWRGEARAGHMREVRGLEVLYFLSIGPFPYPLLCIRFYPQSYHSEG